VNENAKEKKESLVDQKEAKGAPPSCNADNVAS